MISTWIDKHAKKLTAGMVLFTMGLFLVNFFTLVNGRSEVTRIDIFDLTFPVLNLAAAGALWLAARKSATISPRLGRAWLMLAIAQLAYTIADLSWAILEVGLEKQPFPSMADIFYLLYYPLFFLGILWMPVKRSRPTDWYKFHLDIVIISAAALLTFWNFLLGPLAISSAQDPMISQLLTLAYPVFDLILLVTIFVFLFHELELSDARPLYLLAIGASIQIIADSVYGYQSLAGTYASGGVLDLGWELSYLLVMGAGLWQAALVSQGKLTLETNETTQPQLAVKSWVSYTPYLWVVAAFLLLIASHSITLPMSYTAIAVTVGGIIGVVVLRQTLILKENSRLFSDLRQANQQVNQQAEQLSQTNQELQSEIEVRKQAEARLAYDALHDALTGLPNRTLFMDRLTHAIEFSKRRVQYDFAVIFLDLDQFKVVNDSLGHAFGDQMLGNFAQRLRLCLRTSDTVARLSGDEFVILVEDVKNLEDVIQFVRRIQDNLALPFQQEGYQIYITASMGIVPTVNSYEHAEDILRDADIAMYQAKSQGKARYEVFTPNLREQVINRLEMEQEMRSGMEQGEFQLHYQPILSLRSNNMIGFEALLRWNHPKRGTIRPMEFLPLAEETGFITHLGQWVLREACQQMRGWQKHFPHKPPLTISVNISGCQLNQANFADQVREILTETGLEGKYLKLEVNEGVCLNGSESMVKTCQELNEMGIQFQIDDFGIGYSSLSYLQYLPIQTLKIDRIFIDKVNANNNSEIVRAILALARDLGIEAIAEGIETENQLHMLLDLGCNFGQGYLLSRPLDRTAIDSLLTQESSPLKEETPRHLPALQVKYVT